MLFLFAFCINTFGFVNNQYMKNAAKSEKTETYFPRVCEIAEQKQCVENERPTIETAKKL